jgi:hypothetical protein
VSDAHDPGCKWHLAPLVVRQAVEHLDKDLFRHVFGVVDVAQASEAVTVDLVDVCVVQGGKRLQVTRLSGFDNAALGFPVCTGPRFREGSRHPVTKGETSQ